MSNDLNTLRNFIARLADYGVDVVCVGGAARDTYLGVQPKDYDLAVLTVHQHAGEVIDAMQLASGRQPRLLGHEEIAGYIAGEEGHRSRGLLHVIDVRLPCDDQFRDLNIQVLMFDKETTLRYDGDPYNVVVDHDCSLNHAWLEDVQGTLRARVGEEFPSPFTGNFNNFRPWWSNPTRRAYIESKFPEFNHR